MPLSFADQSLQTMNSTNYKATGSQAELVIVEVSHEALQDYGESAAHQKASDKYDAGQVFNNTVTVRTSDFA
jgi:hypothetical protein